MKMVRRFNRTERVAHWVNALGFMMCLLTGGTLAFRHDLTLDETTIGYLVTVHLVGAGIFVLGTLLVWLIGDTRSMVRWVADAFRWNRDDAIWMGFPLFKMLWWPLRMPDMGRFNPGQKVNMIAMMTLKWVFLASGLTMLFTQGALIAFYIHIGSCIATLPLLAVHLFMALINPKTNHALRGMITGWVREEWAKEHHAKWANSPGVETRQPKADEKSDEAKEVAPCPEI